MVEEQLLTVNKAGRANSRRTFGSTTVSTTLWLVILLTAFATAVAQTQDWLKYVRGLSFGERLAEIKRVSTLSQAVQRERVGALIELLKDKDQSVRVVAATEIAEIRDISSEALPQLINNFEQAHGEEGTVYVEAVAAFGERALPPLQQALASSNWLVRSRACDAVRLIRPKLYRDGECKDKAR